MPKKFVSFSCSRDLYKMISEMAKAENRSLSATINSILKNGCPEMPTEEAMVEMRAADPQWPPKVLRGTRS